jgi:hypothetical protein
MSYGAQAAPPQAPDQAIVHLVRKRYQHAANRLVSFHRRCTRWYDYYRGTYRGAFQPFRNNIQIPFTLSVIQSDVARKVQTSFGGWPIVEFAGYSHADAPVARKNEVLISAQMKDCRTFNKAVDFFLSADMYGTGIAQVGWLTERRLQQMRKEIQGPLGPSEQVVKEMVTRFDGPDWDVIDILDAFPQPGMRCVEECDWFIRRAYVDYDRLVEDAQLGLYDQAGLRALSQTNMPVAVETSMLERKNIYRTYTDAASRREDGYAKPVELLHYWGRVPSEMASEGMVWRLITVANGTVLLRNRPMPFWHGKLPFLTYCPMPDPHFFHGIGKIEVAEKMQYAANRIANQKMDGLDMVIDPMWIIDRSRGIDTQNLQSRAGRVIGIDGAVDDTVIRPLSPDIRGMQLAYQEIAQLWQWIQQGTGIIEDTVSGMKAADRETARSAMMRQEAVLTRLMLEARLAEEGFVEPLANMFRALNKQFLQVPRLVKILGSDAMVNPITGFPLPQEPVEVDYDTINNDYQARAVGSTQMLSRAMKQQNLVTLLQAVSANPIAAQMVNWSAFFRQTFEAFDMKNLDELLMPGPTQLAMMGQGQEQSPDQAISQGLSGGDIPNDVMAGVTEELAGQMS